jgi:hypothetical protein
MVDELQSATNVWIAEGAASGGNDPTVTIIIGLIALTGAIAAAVIAAGSASRRQKRQLDDNAARQRDELHQDRLLVDVQELRDVFDDAAGNLSAAARAMTLGHEDWKDMGVVGNPNTDAMRDAQEALVGSARRIRIRLGDHAATRAYEDTADAFSESLRLVGLQTPEEERPSRTSDIEERFAACRTRFFTEAHAIVGSNVDVERQTVDPRSSLQRCCRATARRLRLGVRDRLRRGVR